MVSDRFGPSAPAVPAFVADYTEDGFGLFASRDRRFQLAALQGPPVERRQAGKLQPQKEDTGEARARRGPR